MNNRLAHAFLGATTLVGLIVGTASPATASTYSWIQLPNTTVGYYLPGGPESNYLSNCMVQTTVHDYINGAGPEVWLKLFKSYEGATYPTSCAPSVPNPIQSSVSVVTFDAAGNVFAIDPQTVNLNNATSVGYYNQGFWWTRGSGDHLNNRRYLGAHLSATNQANVTWYWDITAI